MGTEITPAVAADPLVRLTREAGIASLTLNRGDRFNPLSSFAEPVPRAFEISAFNVTNATTA